MSTSAPRSPSRRTGSWHRRATRPVQLWMIALVVLGVVHRWVPASTWTIIHVFTLGLLTNSIFVWGQHFTETLLHQRPAEESRAVQVRRIMVLNAGIVALVAGMIGAWPIAIVAGATVVGGAVAWYVVDLVRQIRAAAPTRFRPIVRYYAVAAAFLPAGAVAGAVMGVGVGEEWGVRLRAFHLAVNVLGFVGITVLTTLVTFWATVLRTPMARGQDAAATRSLAVMAAAVVAAAGASLAGAEPVIAGALGGYLLAVLWHLVYLVRAARSAPPREFASMSIACGLVWLPIALGWATWLVATGRIADLGDVTAPLLAGAAAQILFGAMSFLMPTVMRGGPAAVRAGMVEMNRLAAFRLVLVNVGLIVFLAPGGTSWTRVVGSLLAFVGFVLFLPVMIRAVRAQLRVIRAAAAAREAGEKPARVTADTARAEIAPGRRRNLVGALAALLVAALATGTVLAVDPSSPLRRTDGSAAVAPTGNTTTVEVVAVGMRFEPSTVTVPVGDRLVIELRNDDETTVHDLYLANGVGTGRVEPGETARVDVGVVGRPVEGWCTIAGHKAMGMTFDVQVEGGDPAGGGAGGGVGGAAQDPRAAGHDGHSGAGDDAASPTDAIDVLSPPSDDVETRDPVLPPAPPGREHRVSLTVRETTDELAPGVVRPVWSYNGGLPAPTLRGRVGDTFVVTFRNEGTIGHSIDFHAGDVSPDEVMRTIPPGEELEYRFTVKRAGAWLYHCATAPMSGHVAAGMFGALIVDPPELPEVDREYVLVQSEAYLGGDDEPFDMDKIAARRPDLVMFNGHATQYRRDPLTARVGETVRIWVVAAGPSDGTSFHVVGGQFDIVYKEGAYRLRDGRDAFGGSGGGAQALDLAPSQGGFVEMTPAEVGRYVFVDHSFADAEKGATGFLDVSG
ncbi:multicopper oxidase domain-containing protein [Dietzia cinnamea]|uniref:multicopper oxidase domain-containing protein n=1 Tax=Dietzia cinnamea TaxID=321318 RepID=UPI0021A8098F|nr:multicopper oxidase domain-containing protein [Dietzia cinnamea]MCT2272963.1 multicopper oxidase domain-containing protein [Dietzia cinnamea]